MAVHPISAYNIRLFSCGISYSRGPAVEENPRQNRTRFRALPCHYPIIPHMTWQHQHVINLEIQEVLKRRQEIELNFVSKQDVCSSLTQ